jgi:hypothetical protein
MSIQAILSRISIFSVISIISIGVYVDQGQWRSESMIRGDAHGYCAYLASWVIYQDFTFDFYPDLDAETKNRYWLNQHEGLQPFPKLTMGVAMLQLPGYLMAHWLAGLLGFAQDGWSAPYHLSVGFSGLLAFLIGLFFIRKSLLKRFSTTVSDLSVIVIALMTNAFYYGVLDGAQSHIYSFMLLSVAVYLFDRWAEKRALKDFLIASFCFGLLVLIRPTNGIILIYPLLYFMINKELVNRYLIKSLLIGLLAFLLPLIPQLVFWKMVSGSWVFYSYGEESIYWLSPHIWEGLFSFRNGWLVYTPIMLLAFIGVPFLKKIDRSLMWALVIILPLHVYIVFSWWCWYYGSSLSIRPMIDFYPIFAFAIAAFLRFILTRNAVLYPMFIGLFALLIYNNALQTSQYDEGLLSGSDMTGAAFYTLFLYSDPPSNLKLLGLYEAPDTERLLLGQPERQKRDTLVEESWRLDQVSVINSTKQFGQSIVIPATDFETPFDRIMHVSAELKASDIEKYRAYLVISFDSDDTTYGYYTVEIHKQLELENEWMIVHAYVRKPTDLPASSKMKVYPWYQKGEGQLEVRNVVVQQLDCPYQEAL